MRVLHGLNSWNRASIRILSRFSYTPQVSKECHRSNRYKGYKKNSGELNSGDEQQESVSRDIPWHVKEMPDRTPSRQRELEQQKHTYLGSSEQDSHPCR